MQNLPSIATAQLPQTYEAAKQALAECSQVDECKDWSDKAAALASYAKQADDEQLEKMAKRIRARALRRAGELLKQVDGRQGQNLPASTKVVGNVTFSRAEAGLIAGMSERQIRTSVRVANVPEEQFTEQVESNSPPTISQLAQQGIKRRPVDLQGRDPREFNRAMHYVGAIEMMAKDLDDMSHSETIPILNPKERARLKSALAKIDGHSDFITTRI